MRSWFVSMAMVLAQLLPCSVALALPAASQPAASLPAASQPAASQPAASQPAVARPAVKEGGEEVEEVEDTEVAVVLTEGPSSWWGESHPTLDRGVNLHLAQVTRKLALRLVVDHRTNKPFTENTWHDYFGFDAGSLKIGLGLRFGVWDDLDVGFYRLNSATEAFDVYEWDAKYHLLHQQRHLLELGLRAGITWFSQQDAADAVGGFAQLLINRRFFDRVTVGTGLLFHSDSTNGVKSSADTEWSLATMLIVDLRILGWLSWNAEAAFNLAGYGTRDKRDAESGEAITSAPAFSSSVRFITHRHTFSLVLSNNPYVSSDGYVCNSPRGFDKLIVGFTITREWNF